MKYRKASELFPDELLKEIQKYAAGELVYIPKTGERNDWGEKSGARAYYLARNAEIRRKHLEGSTLEELAEDYGLSHDTIRRILYQ